QKSVSSANDDEALSQLRADALAAKSAGEAAATTLQPQVESVEARLTQLGEVAADSKEAPDIAAQRAQLEKSRSELDAQIKLARLLGVEAEQTAAQIAAQRRQQFKAKLGERTASILGTRFWAEVREDLPQDAAHVAKLGKQLASALAAAPGWTYMALLAGLGLTLALRWWLGRRLRRLTATRVPASRLRRSLYALEVVILTVVTAALATGALGLPFLAGVSAPPASPPAPASDVGVLIVLIFGAVCFGAYVAGLGQALLSPWRPSWRLTRLPDHVATGLRWFPLQMAVLFVLVWTGEGLAALLNISLAATVALNCIMSLAIGTSLALIIMRAEHLHREAAQNPDLPTTAQRPFWLVVLAAAGWLVLAGSLICLLAGYVAFGSFVIKQVAWMMIVLGSAYLLSALAEDSLTTLLASQPAAADAKTAEAGETAAAPEVHSYRIGEQAAVLLSGLSRLVIALLALMLLLAPFGEGPEELFRRTDQLQNGLKIGEVNIQPGAVLQALLVLGLALLAVKVLTRWLQNNYLPTTRLDPGMQLSATTLLGYVGYVCAVSLALSAVGIGLERVAWVASALSVGIGFGLQAVVQNFVSGLILLAERPVKVGDWVSLGGVEGDIRRINMRATEIQLGDRSTVIVPNSEFITKTVRNVTHDNPMGLVQIKLPMPLTTRAAELRALLLEVLQANPDVLETPAPNVQLDGIDNGNLMFNATAYVASPRASYGVRSALLFEALRRLAEAGIEMSKPPTMIAMPAQGTLLQPAAVPPTPVVPGVVP
ncbi:MAG: DUF3772 domain-containing protein, partial [Pseudomonadota bacterium]